MVKNYRLYLAGFFLYLAILACASGQDISKNTDFVHNTNTPRPTSTSKVNISITLTVTSPKIVSTNTPKQSITVKPSLIPTASTPHFALVPFKYLLEDVGNGWNKGQVDIAFENETRQPINIERIRLSEIIIETEEGITYPGELFYTIAQYFYKTNDIGFTFERGIPPGFRFNLDLTDPGFSRSY